MDLIRHSSLPEMGLGARGTQGPMVPGRSWLLALEQDFPQASEGCLAAWGQARAVPLFTSPARQRGREGAPGLRVHGPML